LRHDKFARGGFLTLLRAGTKPLSERVAKIFDDIIAWLDELVGAEKANLDKLLSEQADILRRRKGKTNERGYKYRRKELKLLARDLMERYKDINLEVHIVSDNPLFKLRRKRWERNKTLGAFDKGPPPKIFLEQNCSELTLQHELFHLEDYVRYGADEFVKIPNWKHESSVWEKIWASRERWTQGELVESYRYYKKEVFEMGENPKIIDEMESLLNE
jgi:hypothetical protein